MTPGLILRSVAFNFCFFVTAGAWLILGLPILAVSAPAGMKTAQRLVDVLLWLQRVIVGTKWELRGPADKLRGPRLIAAKHQSAWDTIAFFAMCDWPSYVMKRELRWLPVYGWYTKRLGSIAVDREAGAATMRRMMREAKATLEAGREIIIFPQGSRIAPGTDAPYQPGIVALYSMLKVPVVPVALNSGLFWGRRTFLKQPGTIVVEVLPEIPAGLDRAEFQRRLETSIEEATRRLEDEARSDAGN